MLMATLLNRIQEHICRRTNLNQEVTCYICIVISAAEFVSIEDTDNKNKNKVFFSTY